LVLAIGAQLDPEQIGPVPSNAIIVKRAPQLELLKQSSVCITHAGLNTVLEALSQGVPQVAIPVTHDQPGVAARGDCPTGTAGESTTCARSDGEHRRRSSFGTEALAPSPSPGLWGKSSALNPTPLFANRSRRWPAPRRSRRKRQ
jgi:hypothetical protein